MPITERIRKHVAGSQHPNKRVSRAGPAAFPPHAAGCSTKTSTQARTETTSSDDEDEPLPGEEDLVDGPESVSGSEDEDSEADGPADSERDLKADEPDSENSAQGSDATTLEEEAIPPPSQGQERRNSHKVCIS